MTAALPSRLAVVPRKGDVDRNLDRKFVTGVLYVVPRKGDVDRNGFLPKDGGQSLLSSPARGTWIEI